MIENSFKILKKKTERSSSKFKGVLELIFTINHVDVFRFFLAPADSSFLS
jgi:hypothetical protein